ncbi:MAG: hypothetical protein MZV64_38940 [Ignavibacteriales bacterium]|nr:hypothetical protein [Ignavibacteriales bacterium]
MKMTKRFMLLTLLAIAFFTKVAYNQGEDIVKLNAQKPASEVPKGKQFSVDVVASINSKLAHQFKQT